VWLIDKTSLSFDQIADFVGMHPLEVQAIADGEVAQGIGGHPPRSCVRGHSRESRRVPKLDRLHSGHHASPAQAASR